MAQPPIWVFGVRLVMEIINASHLPVGKDFKTTSYLYNKRGEREGVFAKGLRLKDRVEVKRIVFDGDNWEAEAIVPSESSANTAYTVRIYTPLDFECDCLWGQYRFRPCKHVYATVLRLLEIAGADINDPILKHFIFEGLNKLAYHKTKTHRSLT
jgi:hypothetical protein